MKSKSINWVTMTVLGALCIGMSSSASAGGWDDSRVREIHRAEIKIDDLRIQRDRAEDRHDWRRVHRLENEIDHLRDLIRRDREWLQGHHRDRDHERDHDRRRDY